MRSIALAWEATQDHYGFEAMIFHIPGSRNGFSDACSRDPCPDSLAATLRREADLLGHANMQWTFVSPTLDIPNATPLIDINSLIKCALNFPTQTQTRPAA